MDPAAIERVDSFPYRHQVREMLRPLVHIGAEASLQTAAQRMQAAQVGSLVVLDGDGVAVGIVTERDLLAAVARDGGAALARAVGAVMSRPVASVPADAFLHVAIGRLQRLGIRHLVATDLDGRAIGVVSARALLGLRAGRALALGDEIAQAGSAAALGAARAALPALARGLRAEGMTAAQVAMVLAAALRDLTAQAGALAERELGAPPDAYALLVLGSGGRGESLLAADQDNALIRADADDAWFAGFGQRVADILDTAGVPYCAGGVMAARPAWRHSLAGWSAEVASWVDKAEGRAMLAVDIFFDFAPVRGDVGVATTLRAEALRLAAQAPLFLRLLAQQVEDSGSALGLLGRWRSKEGRVDLKRGGLWPIVAFARTLALRSGVGATGTLDRLAGAAAAGRLKPEEAERLAAAFELILVAILDQQLIDLANGRAAGNWVELARLSRDRRNRLKEALRGLDGLPLLLQDALTS